jgi:glycine betaine/proline transport system substrate-binding protein
MTGGVAAAVLVGSVALSAATPPAAKEADPATLRLGRIDESFYQAAGVVVQRLIERSGQRVVVVDGSHTETYEAVAAGKVDLCVAFWLPDGHAGPWKRAAGHVEEVATIFDGARFFWAVPEYLPPEVKAIADLARPEIAAKMPKTIRGLSLDATITTASQTAVQHYGLASAGYRLTPGTFGDWRASLDQAESERRWVALPLWQPYYFNRKYHLRALADPDGLLGGMNRVIVAAHAGSAHKLSLPARSTLRRMRLTIEDVTAMDYAINVDRLSPEAAADRWLAEHEALVGTWVTDVK